MLVHSRPSPTPLVDRITTVMLAARLADEMMSLVDWPPCDPGALERTVLDVKDTHVRTTSFPPAPEMSVKSLAPAAPVAAASFLSCQRALDEAKKLRSLPSSAPPQTITRVRPLGIHLLHQLQAHGRCTRSHPTVQLRAHAARSATLHPIRSEFRHAAPRPARSG